MLVFTLTLLFAMQHHHTGGPAPDDVGVVSFPNSGTEAAQKDFLRGLALLHNFEYDHAAESFRKAQQIDPDFAMARWGEAMTHNHPIWFNQDREAARAILGQIRTPPKTQRERDYLRTLDVLYGEGTKEDRDLKYAEAMRALAAKYPDDVDATAFYALSILGTAHKGRDFTTYMRAAAVLEEVFPRNQRHPGVLHYLIHSYDDPIHAPLGMRAARVYGSVAPNAGHALHMTSHIFVAMGMWEESIDANRRAAATTGRPCGHYPIWLHYSLLQLGRVEEARKTLEDCGAAASKEAYQSRRTPIDAEESKVGSYAMMRTFHMLDGSAPADDSWTVPIGPYVAPKFAMAYADAVAAWRRKDLAALREQVTLIRRLQKDLLTAIDTRAFTTPSYRQRAEIIVQQAGALLLLAEGKKEEGIALLRKAADAEMAMSWEYGPPVVEKPSLELLGETLLSLGRREEARRAFETAVQRTPGRRAAVEGLKRASP